MFATINGLLADATDAGSLGADVSVELALLAQVIAAVRPGWR